MWPGSARPCSRCAPRRGRSRGLELDGLPRRGDPPGPLVLRRADAWGSPASSALGRSAGYEAEVGRRRLLRCISGFLIILPMLLREEDRDGSISLRRVLRARRKALRLVPTFAAYLIFVAALAHAEGDRAGVGDSTGSPRRQYTINGRSLLGHSTSWALGHLPEPLGSRSISIWAWPVALGDARAGGGALTSLMVVLALSPGGPGSSSGRPSREAPPLGLLKTFTPAAARRDRSAGCLLGFVVRDPNAHSSTPPEPGRARRSSVGVAGGRADHLGRSLHGDGILPRSPSQDARRRGPRSPKPRLRLSSDASARGPRSAGCSTPGRWRRSAARPRTALPLASSQFLRPQELAADVPTCRGTSPTRWASPR